MEITTARVSWPGDPVLVKTTHLDDMLEPLNDESHQKFDGEKDWGKLKNQFSALKKRIQKNRKANKEARVARRLHRQGK